jgi:hypothetical protein
MSVYQDDMAEATVRLLYIENLGYLLLDAVGYMRAAKPRANPPPPPPPSPINGGPLHYAFVKVGDSWLRCRAKAVRSIKRPAEVGENADAAAVARPAGRLF